MDTILNRNGFEFTRDPVSGEVSCEATDYHSGKLTVNRELLDVLEAAVGTGTDKQAILSEMPQVIPDSPPK